MKAVLLVLAAFLPGMFSGSATTGYNDLLNLPQVAGVNSSSSNRPVYADGVLTWTGPVGGGPSTGSDQVQTLALTYGTAQIASSADGQTISGNALFVGGGGAAVLVQNNNVTVTKNFLCAFGNFNSSAVQIKSGVTGTVIEDNELCGTDSQAQGGTYCLTGFTSVDQAISGVIRRNNVFGCEKLIGRNLENLTIIDNLFHGTSGTDSDMVAPWANSTNDTIQHNYFNGADYVANYIATLGTITGGSGYTPGTYHGIPLTGGTGSQATANITVNGSGIVSAVALIYPGTAYTVSDVLSASTAYLGPGSGFSVPVATITAGTADTDSSINMSNFPTGAISNITITGNASANPQSSNHEFLSDNSFSATTITGLVLTNNGFTTPNVSAFYAVNGSNTVTTNSGNFIMGSPLSNSGTLVNGATGVLVSGGKN